MNKYYSPQRQVIKQKYCKRCGRPLFSGEGTDTYCEECEAKVWSDTQKRMSEMRENLVDLEDKESEDAFNAAIDAFLKMRENEEN